MPFVVLLRPAAERDLRALPSDTRLRISEVLRALEQEPRPHGTVKLAGRLDRWRIRVGDYRILRAHTRALGFQLVPVTPAAGEVSWKKAVGGGQELHGSTGAWAQEEHCGKDSAGGTVREEHCAEAGERGS